MDEEFAEAVGRILWKIYHPIMPNQIIHKIFNVQPLPNTTGLMRPHRFRKKIEQHLSNQGNFAPHEITEISGILKQFPSTENHSDLTSEKAKLYLAKALAELEVHEKDGKILFYENKKSWWARNYPWVLSLIGVIIAGVGAYINYLKVVKP